ncbi:MAG: hydrogenase maturation protease [Bacteroidota bacterium]
MRTLVLGVGNALRGDDAIGPRIVAELRSRSINQADLWSVDGDLFEIEALLNGYGRLVIIDALPPGESPGRLDVTIVGPKSLPCRSAYSLHDMDLVWQLRLIAGSFKGEIMLIGIEAHSVDYSAALSPELARKLPLLAEEAAQAIESFVRDSGLWQNNALC